MTDALQRLSAIAAKVYRLQSTTTNPDDHADLHALLTKIGEIQLRLAQQDTDRGTTGAMEKQFKVSE